MGCNSSKEVVEKKPKQVPKWMRNKSAGASGIVLDEYDMKAKMSPKPDGIFAQQFSSPDVSPVKSLAHSNHSLQASRGRLVEYYFIHERVAEAGDWGRGYQTFLVTDRELDLDRTVIAVPKHHDEDATDVEERLNLIKGLSHSNIVTFFEAFEDHREIYLVVEVCTGGLLLRRIVEEAALTEAEVAQIMRQILYFDFLLIINYLKYESQFTLRQRQSRMKTI